MCGSEDVSLTESRRVRQGLDRLNPAFKAEARRYELCAGCGSKREPA
ncbi:hypothetical protein [Blastococcus sp. URHD0036]|nr:hypothetical protein [Blastococcus sp. URHD0036]